MSIVDDRFSALEGLMNVDALREQAASEAPPKGSENTNNEAGVKVDTQAKSVAQIAREANEKRAHSTSEAEQNNVETNSQEEEGVMVNDPLFGGTKRLGGASTPTFDAKALPQELVNDLKNLYGVEDPGKFFSEDIGNWHKAASMVTDLQKQVGDYQALVQSLPNDLYVALERFLEGGDYKEPIMSNPGLDMSKQVDSIPDKALVKAYFADSEFTDEDWDEYKSKECDPRLKKAMDITVAQSRERFKAEQAKLQQERQQADHKKAARARSFNDSLQPAVQNLRRAIPDADPAFVSAMERKLQQGGEKAIRDAFLKEDGSLREDGVLKLVMAERGYDLVKQLSSKAASKAVQKERVELLERTAERANANGASSGSQEMSPDMRKYMDSLLSGLDKKPFY